MSVFLRSLLLCLVAAWTVAAQNPAYVFRGDEIHVDQAAHWRNWTYQNNMVGELSTRIDSTGLFQFTAAGIKPKYLAPVQNYVLDREEFTYFEQVVLSEGKMVSGGATALTNDGLAGKVGDDDVRTYWEPAPEDFSKEGLRNWQLQINLGRCVWADSVVVLFPPVQPGGDVVVPLVPEEALRYGDLSLEQQLAVDRFGRRVALDSVRAEETLISANGDTLVTAGEVLIHAGRQLPRSLATLKLLAKLGVTQVAVRGLDDPGDVPKMFAVEVSMGRRAGDSSSKNYRFTIVGRGTRSGDQRRYSFPLEPLDRADFDGDGIPDAQGTFAHLVRFTVFESDFDQLEFLGEDAEGQALYDSLSAERRGLRAYFRRTQGDFLKKVSKEVYEGLEAGARGPIRYYKRELPRVAEIQVWGPGPNVAYRMDQRAGVAYEDGQGTVRAPLSFDGVYASWSRWLSDPYYSGFSTNGGAIPGKDQIFGTVWADLGASFWVNRIFIGSLTTHDNTSEGTFLGYYIMASDGTAMQPLDLRTPADFVQLEYGLAWKDLVSELHKDNWDYQARIMEEEFDLRKIRFLEYRHVDPRKLKEGQYGATAYVNEFQLYGRGYPAEVSFTSPPIVLQQGIPSSEAGRAEEREIVSEIYWDTEAVLHSVDPLTGQQVETADLVARHPELKIEIQTRTSDTVDSLITYYEVTGLGSSSEQRKEVDVESWQSIVDLWAVYEAWNAMPDKRIITLRPHRTNRDDDGDGLVDEDPTDGVDNDDDGMIDEDGLTGETGGPNARGVITLLKHKRKRDDDGDGPVDEDPIDGVDNDLDGLIDEDGKHKRPPPMGYDQVVSPYFAGWSAWSQPYAPTAGQNKAQISSPSPRKFLQLRVNIISEDPELTGRVKSLRVDLAPPISMEVAGELAVRTAAGVARPVADLAPAVADYAPPVDIDPLGQQALSYFVRAAGPDPHVAEVKSGFNEVLLLSPFAATLSGVRVGTVDLREEAGPLGDNMVRKATRSTFTQAFSRDADGVFRSADGAVLGVHTAGDSVLMTFPTSLNEGSGDLRNTLVEVQFETQTLRDGTQVLAFVRAEGETVFQRVEAEGRDVTELVDSDTSIPRLLQSHGLVQDVHVGEVITPNGDGSNDLLPVRFSLLHLRQERPVLIRFHDLAGRQVREQELRSQSGVVEYEWDGRDDDGNMVLPGIYLCQITLKADDKDVEIVRLVSVAY